MRAFSHSVLAQFEREVKGGSDRDKTIDRFNNGLASEGPGNLVVNFVSVKNTEWGMLRPLVRPETEPV